jgi:lipopolysaccharide transport system ATP-binding protein
MTDETAIIVENLSKSYLIGHGRTLGRGYQTFRETMIRGLNTFAHKTADVLRGRQIVEGDEVEEFWALEDVSFEVKRGEVLGVIGRNGAGKSTLLKVLSRITEPTKGRVRIRGRVASLLEVGTGFHPELTGRENIFLNGAILGMARTEIWRKFDEIIAFAEVEKFLDTPVKRYSSGMYVRLAFAVAAHLESEILVVDEVLAVGDAAFQKKCLGKMSEVASGHGRTVLFVSHNMGAVSALCSRAIALERGTIASVGPADGVISDYLDGIAGSMAESGRVVWADGAGPGEAGFRLREVSVRGTLRKSYGFADTDEPVEFACTYTLGSGCTGARVIFQLITAMGEVAFASTDHDVRLSSEGEIRTPGEAEYRSACLIPAGLLNRGNYTIRLRVGIPGSRVLIPDFDACRLSVSGKGLHGSSYDSEWPGVVCPQLPWTVERLP